MLLMPGPPSANCSPSPLSCSDPKYEVVADPPYHICANDPDPTPSPIVPAGAGGPGGQELVPSEDGADGLGQNQPSVNWGTKVSPTVVAWMGRIGCDLEFSVAAASSRL